MDDDPLTNELAEIREIRREAMAEFGPAPEDSAPDAVLFAVSFDIPRLLAAVDAVLAITGKWQATATQGANGRIGQVAAIRADCARQIREAVTGAVVTGDDPGAEQRPATWQEAAERRD